MKELISIIVPVFNVKPYLNECLDSIIRQTYKNLEIIIVDDGSTDGSENICDEYEKNDSRIKVIHQENKGLSVARNVGIELCKGKYIMFVDSDDYIHPEMAEALYKVLINNKADISYCNYSNDENLSNEKGNYVILDNLEKMLNELYGKNYVQTVISWNKLYKRELFAQIFFPKNKRNEDEFVIHRLLEKCNRIVYMENKLYYYRIRKGSIMNSEYSLKNLDYLEAVFDRMQFMKKKGYDYFYSREFYRYVNGLRINYNKMKKYFPNEKEKLKEILIKFLEFYNKDSRKLIIKKRIRFRLDLFRITAKIKLKNI